MVHDLITAVFLNRSLDSTSDISQRAFPADTLPLPVTPPAYPLQWIKDAVRVVDLVEGGGSFGAVATA